MDVIPVPNKRPLDQELEGAASAASAAARSSEVSTSPDKKLRVDLSLVDGSVPRGGIALVVSQTVPGCVEEVNAIYAGEDQFELIGELEAVHEFLSRGEDMQKYRMDELRKLDSFHVFEPACWGDVPQG
eukprot:4071515-Amphidinium_carterae.1